MKMLSQGSFKPFCCVKKTLGHFFRGFFFFFSGGTNNLLSTIDKQKECDIETVNCKELQ